MKPKENTYYISWRVTGFRLYYIKKVVDNPNFDKELANSKNNQAFKYHINGILLCGSSNLNNRLIYWNKDFEWYDGHNDIILLMYNNIEDYSQIEEFGFSNSEKSELFDRMFI